MKNLIAFFVIAFLGMGVAQAQDTTTQDQTVTTTVSQEVLDQLNLTTEQSASVTKILNALQPMRTQIQESNLNDQDKARKLGAYANREKLNMKNILNDTQYVQYLELTGRI